MGDDGLFDRCACTNRGALPQDTALDDGTIFYGAPGAEYSIWANLYVLCDVAVVSN